jgi:hypothetical protein
MAVQLATPYSISGPGITAETDAYAAATRYTIDTVGQAIQVTFPLRRYRPSWLGLSRRSATQQRLSRWELACWPVRTFRGRER